MGRDRRIFEYRKTCTCNTYPATGGKEHFKGQLHCGVKNVQKIFKRQAVAYEIWKNIHTRLHGLPEHKNRPFCVSEVPRWYIQARTGDGRGKFRQIWSKM